MRIGIYVSTAQAAPLERILAGFRRAEEWGLHTAWAGQVFEHDALTLLALAGRETRRIELGSWVVPIQPRHPAALAQQALTAQLACAGRLLLGIGISHAEVIAKRLGLPFRAPEPSLRAYLAVLRGLLRGESGAPTAAARPLRLDFPGVAAPPLFVAALGPQMLALAGRAADGVAIWLGGPNYLRDFAVPRLREAAAAAGRAPPRIASGLPVLVTGERERGLAAARALVLQSSRLPAYQRVLAREGADAVEQVAIVGDAEAVAARIRALAGLGVTDFHAIPVPLGPGDAALGRTLEVLASLARSETPA